MYQLTWCKIPEHFFQCFIARQRTARGKQTKIKTNFDQYLNRTTSIFVLCVALYSAIAASATLTNAPMLCISSYLLFPSVAPTSMKFPNIKDLKDSSVTCRTVTQYLLKSFQYNIMGYKPEDYSPVGCEALLDKWLLTVQTSILASLSRLKWPNKNLKPLQPVSNDGASDPRRLESSMNCL